MLKFIPNIFTSLNLLCGCIAVIAIVLGEPIGAVMFMLLGIFFDFFDGLAARLLKVTSEVGTQLDSLADVITSGLAPALIMMYLLCNALWDTGINGYFNLLFYEGELPTMTENQEFLWLPATGLLIVVASAYRLAKFNVDERQKTGFIGLPTPANAIFIGSLVLITQDFSPVWAYELLTNPWVLFGITLLSSLMLNAEVALFSLKLKSLNIKENLHIYLFLLLSIAALLVFKLIAIPFVIIGYIVSSIVKNLISTT